jgi:hypothetical protein
VRTEIRSIVECMLKGTCLELPVRTDSHLYEHDTLYNIYTYIYDERRLGRYVCDGINQFCVF